MSNPSTAPRDVIHQIQDLVDAGRRFTDIHIEQDEPMMLKLPRGWSAAGPEPVTLAQMRSLLDTIDEDWEDKIVERAIDRLVVLADARLRCNVYRAKAGHKVCVSVRRLPRAPLSLEQTGLPPYVKTMLEANRGIIMVTGPTGSGKTTTIAAMLDYLNQSRSAHIITIEEPIEFGFTRKLAIISQREVPTDAATFASGLREAMRQLPDVLMVGEIRDPDTAATVLHAGESGHLVLATLHTNSAMSAITRLLSYFPAEQRDQHAATLATALIGVICQSLVPAEDGGAFVLASELLFNNNQQVAPFIADASRQHLIADFMRRKEDHMSRSLNDILAELVGKKQISAKDAMRASYNRMELNDMLGSQR
jgi:twitching motility protein PilT